MKRFISAEFWPVAILKECTNRMLKAFAYYRWIKTSFLEALYPSGCLACAAAVDLPDSLCAMCWRQMRFISPPFCQKLGVPFTIEDCEGLISPGAIADPPDFDRARAATLYEGVARQLVHRLKYGDQHNLSKGLANMMAHAGSELLHDADILMPIPLHVTRLWKRRFNQAMLLARHLSRMSGKPCDPFLLQRIKRTPPQFTHTRNQRKDSMRGAFQVSNKTREAVEGRRVLLIDDVRTTGATVNAAARALLREKAKAVDVLTFALTPPPGLTNESYKNDYETLTEPVKRPI